jgi:rubrerythrin
MEDSNMEHTFQDLKQKTVAELREIAKAIEHDAVKGYTQLNKEHLLKAVCTALNIDMHVHHDVVGVDKSKIKREIRKLKLDRDKALEAHDQKKLKDIRRQIKKHKNQLRKAMV